jgi:SP family sugar:H+ symporter-like MFS transporter
MIGMFGTGSIGDLGGRRCVMYLIILITMVGAVLEATATGWRMWAGAKAVMGFGTGLMQAGVSSYIAEVAPREIRGICLSTFNLLSASEFHNSGHKHSYWLSEPW